MRVQCQENTIDGPTRQKEQNKIIKRRCYYVHMIKEGLMAAGVTENDVSSRTSSSWKQKIRCGISRKEKNVKTPRNLEGRFQTHSIENYLSSSSPYVK